MPTRQQKCLFFDWGDTLMRVFPGSTSPMGTWPQVEALDYAADILSGLRSEWTLALATNAEASEEAEVWAALARGGLGGLLDKVYCFRQIGYKKPSREFFAHILKDLGLTPWQVVMVGDDFESDVAGATQWEIPAIWLNERTAEDRTGHRYRNHSYLGRVARRPRPIGDGGRRLGVRPSGR